jgi:hypothetical protein
MVRWITQAQASWAPATTFSLGEIYLRPTAPNQGQALDFGEILLIQLSYPVSESRGISIKFIGCHPLKRQISSLDGATQQFQADFGLGLERQALWHAACGAFGCVFYVKSCFWHEQLPFNQAITLATGIPQVNPYLRVSHLPNRAAVLRSHSDRVVFLLNYSRFVDQGDSIDFTQRFSHQTLMNGDHRFLFLGALTDVMLHTAHIFFQPKCHLFDVFARRIPQQAAQVDFAPFQLLAALKGRFKQLHVIRHFVHKLLYILLRQIAFWRRTSVGYNSHGHCFLYLLSTGWWLEKDTMPLHF